MAIFQRKTGELTIRAAGFAALAFCVLVALGTWQLCRLEWKTDLLQKIDSQMAAPAQALPAKMESPQEWEYRRVSFAGRLLKGREFLLKPRTQDGKSGYHRVVPIEVAKGRFVFVNLGWVDDAGLKEAAALPRYMTADGVVTLPKKGRFTPENDIAKNDWYWADIPAMADAAGLKNKEVMPVLIVMGSGMKPDVPNDHLQYAVFWFFMAFVVVIIFFVRFFERGSKK